MILIHGQHFLTDEGRSYFPIFIKNIEIAMKEYNKGFISIRQIKKVNESDETHFLLEYESFELLKEFSKTTAHDNIQSTLKKFQLKSPHVIKYFF